MQFTQRRRRTDEANPEDVDVPCSDVLRAAGAGRPIDPECTAEKAAKGTASKATVGVGGRCTPAEAAKDQTKNAVGIDDKKGKDKKKDKDQGPSSSAGTMIPRRTLPRASRRRPSTRDDHGAAG